jgi:hypothetical protein
MLKPSLSELCERIRRVLEQEPAVVVAYLLGSVAGERSGR